jgi:hypothetical protein
MSSPTQPVDIVNRALDECGVEALGDLEEGSPAARAATRIYTPTLRQLLSGAHWNFARKEFQMVLLADYSGQNAVDTDVPTPWAYLYAWPVDCVHARFVPQTYPQQSSVGTPIFASAPPPTVTTLGWNSPAPFIVSSANRPNPITSQWWEIEGADPDQSRVILTNQLGATLIYTALMQYPDAWDPLFEQAMVSALAARLAMPLIKNHQEARVIRQDNIMIAKGAIEAARIRDGDEGWTIVDHTPDWIRARTTWAGWTGPGVLYYPWWSIPWLEDAGGTY